MYVIIYVLLIWMNLNSSIKFRYRSIHYLLQYLCMFMILIVNLNCHFHNRIDLWRWILSWIIKVSSDEIAHVLECISNYPCNCEQKLQRSFRNVFPCDLSQRSTELETWKFTTVKELKDTESQQCLTFCNFVVTKSEQSYMVK